MHTGPQDLLAFAQVLLIDLVLAGDNALVVGLVVARLPKPDRHKAVLLGIGGAALMRLGLAAITMQLLKIMGLTLAGGVLLLWVCWKTYRDLRGPQRLVAGGAAPGLMQAMVRIMVADLSMSLDNVLAVAGAALGRPWVMAAGLILSVVLMGAAATLIARLLTRYRFLGWGGLAVILFVALKLIWEGGHQVMAALI
jgi:YjbE family integral membrane protein